MKINCHIKDIYKICMKKTVRKQSERPHQMPNIHIHMQAFVMKAVSVVCRSW